MPAGLPHICTGVWVRFHLRQNYCAAACHGMPSNSLLVMPRQLTLFPPLLCSYCEQFDIHSPQVCCRLMNFFPFISEVSCLPAK